MNSWWYHKAVTDEKITKQRNCERNRVSDSDCNSWKLWAAVLREETASQITNKSCHMHATWHVICLSHDMSHLSLPYPCLPAVWCRFPSALTRVPLPGSAGHHSHYWAASRKSVVTRGTEVVTPQRREGVVTVPTSAWSMCKRLKVHLIVYFSQYQVYIE